MNKNISYKVKWTIGCLLWASLAAGCAQDDALTADKGSGNASGGSFVSLSFTSAQPSPTRANPTGEETGDGYEKGQSYENEINSAVVFFFTGSGVNAEANTKIDAVVEFNNISYTDGNGNGIDHTYNKTSPQQVDLDDGTYQVIVVANPGTDDRWWTSPTLTLGDVRDHIQKTAWAGSDTDGYSNFVMTSAADASLTLASNTEDNPATTTVDVERMAARLDYKAEGDFKLTDDNYPDATVKILGATIINDFNAGSYLLKRVSDDPTAQTGDAVTYLGKEELENGLPTNYVIDPWTASKTFTNADLTLTPFTVDGKSVSAAGLYADGSYLYSGSEDPKWWSDRITECPSITKPENEGDWRRVGYTLENTTAQDQTAKTYNTGLAFKAQFNPGNALHGYVNEHTFFRYGDKLYTSLTSMMGQLNDQLDFAEYFNTEVQELRSKTWNDVTAFCESLSYDPVGLAAYFTRLQNGAEASAAVGTALDNVTWAAFLATLGVDETTPDAPQINQGGQDDTRAKLYESSNGLLRTYYQGFCYYIWWLRHCNNGNETNGLMEYAVVRNNIYEVTVNGVASIGGDVPDDTELKAHVYVKDWDLLLEETLPM